MKNVAPARRLKPFIVDRVFATPPCNGEFSTSTENAPASDARLFTQANLESAHRVGFEEGFAQGKAAGAQDAGDSARAATEAQVANVLAAIEAELSRLSTDHADMFESVSAECERLVRAILERLLPELVRRGGVEEIVGLMRLALSIGANSPVLRLLVGPELIESVGRAVRPIVAKSAYRGSVEVLSDPALAGGKARVNWSHGSAERDPQAMLASILILLSSHLGQIDAADNHGATDSGRGTETPNHPEKVHE